ncbi:MAG TPA: AraC family transcriptional regulator [Pedobacter sp.]|jgi:AraC-like DNA-binding protein
MKNTVEIDTSILKLVQALGIEKTEELSSGIEKFDIQVFEVYDFVPDMLLTVRSYLVNQDFKHRFGNIKSIENGILFSFHNFFTNKLNQDTPDRIKEEIPHVRIIPMTSTQEYNFYKNTHMKHVSILVSENYLKSFLREDAPKFAYLLNLNGSFIIEEFMGNELLQTVNEIVNGQAQKSLTKFYFHLKALELLYLLFHNLEKREQTTFQSIAPIEIETIYRVRDKLISRLDEAPSLSELKVIAGINEIKLRILFTQIFGMGIYEYFQFIRMKEAGRQLKETNKNVSEVGYDLGFSNLSHFSREFEKYIGMKPKKYQKVALG